ncbi:Shwachman-Bodian-diamond syndrome protein [Tothia fuscella]|uniref:Ribosome maturation protein SDO1 n=1 Tax=Tothia fuscella TaxID=1048955 RepID=A0A9P4TYE2_9PEZI|nr:Shwachman-Bodian-diamond syndrome protein [Tothia fuscella]
MQINQPSNQIKLTNVSLVKIKKGKKRFEIACYKNKVLEYRSGVEKDLDNVLQIPNVFINVSKGQVANKDDLSKSFPSIKLDDIILEILNKGELQVGEKERAAELERVHNEVVDIVAGKVVDPKTKRVYTVGMIEKALDMLSSQAGHQGQAHKEEKKEERKEREHAKEEAAAAKTNEDETAAAPTEAGGNADDKGKDKEKEKKHLPKWTGVTTTKSAKSQALEAMKALIAHQPIPIARARMRLRITCPTSILKHSVKSAPKEGEDKSTGTVKDRILSFVEQVETQDVIGDEWEVVGFVEPGAFKSLTEFVGTQTKGKARAEVLDMAVIHEDD